MCESTAHAWLERVEANPRFRFTATAADVREVRAGFDPLARSGRLGAVLLQFLWSFRRTPENGEWLDDLVATFDDYPLVLEVRHGSWNEPAFFRELKERGLGFVHIDQPQFKQSIGPTAHATSAVGYVRVHGRNYRDWWRKDAAPHEHYDYLYTEEELRPWAGRAEAIAAEPDTEEVYVITNNHYRGKAAANALMVHSMIEERSVAGPPPLFSEYGEVLEGFAHPAAPADSADKEPLEELTKRELYERARRREIAGRSRMPREELIRARRAA